MPYQNSFMLEQQIVFNVRSTLNLRKTFVGRGLNAMVRV